MNALIENSPNKDFFELLLTYQNAKAAELAKSKLKEDADVVGNIMLKSWLKAGNYATTEELGNIKLNFEKDYAAEIAEMGRLVDALLSELKQREAAKLYSESMTKLLSEAAQHIQQAAQGYSQGATIPANVWMDGAVLRDWALYLATYFEDKKDYENELQMRFLRCKITNSIMNHYMHLVGPDMIGVGKVLEKINLPDRAFQFYHAVRLDFAWLLPEHANSEEISEEEQLSLWALGEAYKGILRIGKSEEPQQDEMRVMLIDALFK
jgi:hypothetical protein